MGVYSPEYLKVTYSFLSQIQTESVRSIFLWMFIICSVTVLRSFLYMSLEGSPCPKDLDISLKKPSNKIIPVHFRPILRNKSVN